MNTMIRHPLRNLILALCCALVSATVAGNAAPAANTGQLPAAHAPDQKNSQEGNTKASDKPLPATTEPGAVDSTVTDSSATQTATTDSDEYDYDWRSSSKAWRRHHHKGHGDEIVAIGHNVTLSEDRHTDAVVAIFGSVTSAGTVNESVVSVLGSSHVTGTVGDSVVAVMGSVYVNGPVEGDVISVFGNMELGPKAVIRGDVVVFAGTLTRDPDAVVHGDVQELFTGIGADFEWLSPWIQRCLLYGRPLAFVGGLGWAWGIALGFLALYVLLALMFRGGVERCAQTLEERPGQSFLAALLTMLLTPVAFVLLCITVLGIAAVPFLALALLCAGFFGKVVVLATLGRRCGSFLTPGETLNPAIAVIIGGALVLLLYTVPIVGFITYKLLGILGLGVVVYTLLLAFKASRQPLVTPSAGGPGAAGGPSAAGGGGSGAPGGGGPDAGTQPYSSVNATANVGAQGGAASRSGPGSRSGADASGGASYGTPGGHDFVASAGSGPMGGASSQSGTASGTGADAASASAGGVGTGAGSAGSGGAGMSGSASAGEAAGVGGSSGGSTGAGGTTAGSATLSVAERLALPRAGFWIRIGALLLDALLIGILVHTGHDGFDVSLLLLAAYGAVMWKFKGTTVGGIICGLQVVRLDGREIDWATAIVRALSCFLSLAVVGLGFIWIAIDDEHQGWHDKIAGTVVVRSPKGHSLL